MNRFGYGENNPVANVDPSGHAIETPFDVVSVGLDWVEFQRDPTPMNALVLGVDALAVAIPGIPSGVGLTYRGVRTALDLAPLVDAGAKAISGATPDEMQDSCTTRGIIHLGDQFTPPVDIGTLSRMEYGNVVQKAYRQAAPSGQKAERSIRDTKDLRVVSDDGRYGRPDRQYIAKPIIRELKPIPRNRVNRARDYLVETYSEQILFCQDLYQRGFGVKPDVYIDWYIMP